MNRADYEKLRRLLIEQVAARCGVPVHAVPGDRPLADLGLSSRDAVGVAGELSRATGRELPATLLWETPTVDGLVARLAADDARPHLGEPARPSPAHGSGGTAADEPVAVVGVGCRLPGGVRGPADYWRLLEDGVDAVRRVPGDRWRDFTDAPPPEANPWGGYLEDVAGFDAEFFRIPPREAATMDPQQRMLLETAWEALDHAAIPAASLAGTATGVFVGISSSEYGQLTGAALESVAPWAPTGAAPSIAAGRLSYALDLRGPSTAVDTACSSSLVAVHLACTSLRTGESDTALAAGVNLLLSPAVTVAFQRAGALAPDGRCKAFSAAADGIGRAEGCAVVVLKRLRDAERDGDRILAVVRATGVNSDGRSNGLMAPNPEAQSALLETVYARAGLDPATVDLVEAHGTGTPLGDPIEAGALGTVLGRGRDVDQPLLLGSAKSNLGHLESAAGVAGLVKTVLALHHDLIPASLHCDRTGPHPGLDALRLRVVTEPEPWPRYSGTATAGVSAFGFGGTNAHAVLEEWRPAPAAAGPAPAAAVYPVSDADAARVRDTAARIADWLDTPDGRATPLADTGRTLAGRAGRGPARAAVVAADRADLAAGLRALAEGRPDPRVVAEERDRVGRGPVWVFSGYGTGWAGMGRGLLRDEPAFAAAVAELEPHIAAACGFSLREELERGEATDRLAVAQPVLFGVQTALAALWRSYGAEPAAVVGHSMGEVAAAVAAGALEPADGARVIAERSRLLDTLRGGAMAVVDLADGELDALADGFPGVHPAVYSSPSHKVVTGAEPAVRALVEHLAARGRTARAMRVAGAGHSPLVDPLLPPLRARLADVRGRGARVAVYSTVLDDPRAAPAFDAEYWAANLRRPVRLAQAVAAAAADGFTAFVEVSPHPALRHPLADTLRAAGVDAPLVLPTLRRDADEARAFHTHLAALHAAGRPLPARRLHPAGRVADVPLPRWRHRRHWWTDQAPDAAPEPDPAPAAASGPATAADPLTARLIHHVAEVTGHPSGTLTPGTALADLGMDSLMAVRVRTAVEHEWGAAPPLADLLRARTLRDAAEAVAALLPESSGRRARVPVAAGGAPAPPQAHVLSRPSAAAPRTGVSGPPARTGVPVPGPGAAGRKAAPSARRAAAADGHPVRTIRAAGGAPPLFLAHAAGGRTAVYDRLARALGGDRPVYGLERLEEGTVGERAARYAEAVRAVRPGGPYVLGGWSFGGFLAQETARRLTARGERVEAVVLIDSVRPLLRPDEPEWERARRHFEGFAAHAEAVYGARLDLPFDRLAGLDDRGRIDLVLAALAEAADVPAAALEHQRTSYLDMRTGEAHRPGPYAGRVILYRATEPAPHTVHDPAYDRGDDALGWDEVCPDLEVVPVPGHHLSLLDPPHAEAIAAHLTRALAASRSEIPR